MGWFIKMEMSTSFLKRANLNPEIGWKSGMRNWNFSIGVPKLSCLEATSHASFMFHGIQGKYDMLNGQIESWYPFKKIPKMNVSDMFFEAWCF